MVADHGRENTDNALTISPAAAQHPENARRQLPLRSAEGEGFEPPDPGGSPVFKTGALNQLGHPSARCDALKR